LAEINAFLEGDSPAHAKRWRDSVRAEVDLLEAGPLLGGVVPVGGSDPLREILLENYRLVYRIEGDDIYIVTILGIVKVPDIDVQPSGGDEFPNT
jgi:plasmid stabilization system protein ParE